MVQRYSKMGSYHTNVNGENQDAIYCGQNNNCFVISLADGVSSCLKSRTGAEIASRSITDLLVNKGTSLLNYGNEQIADFVLSHIFYELDKEATHDEKDVKEYSSTIASVFIDRKKGEVLCINLGDSIILGIEDGKCRVLAMPADSTSGCCVTTTTNAHIFASVSRYEEKVFESIVICSDGAWKSMYEKNKLKPLIGRILVEKDYNGLASFLSEQDCYDDSSFISLNFQNENRRRSA